MRKSWLGVFCWENAKPPIPRPTEIEASDMPLGIGEVAGYFIACEGLSCVDKGKGGAELATWTPRGQKKWP
jgi:hypothetical protein